MSLPVMNLMSVAVAVDVSDAMTMARMIVRCFMVFSSSSFGLFVYQANIHMIAQMVITVIIAILQVSFL